jgi:peptidoglycan/LPS O-acetylase OafA/YrhL
MKSEKSKYIHSLDSLRGIASLMVAFFHFSAGNRIYLAETNPLREIGRHGWVGVEIFFIISGFVIPYSMYRANYTNRNLPRFLLKRITRIDPPYFVSIALVLFLLFLSTQSAYYRGDPFEINIKQLLLHFGYLNAFFDEKWLNPVYWSLAIEFQYYIIIALIFPLLNSGRYTVRYITMLAFILSAYLIPAGVFVFKFSLLFVIGIILCHKHIGKIKKAEFYIVIALLIGMSFFTYHITIFIASLLSILFIIALTDFKNPVLNFLGRISYSLYLIHIPIGGRVINLTEQFIENELIRSLMVFVALGVSIFSAWIFYLLFEKWSKKLSSKISYKKSTTEPIKVQHQLINQSRINKHQ